MAFIGLSKPRPRDVSPPPCVGELAPEGAALECLGGRGGLLVFLRHVGCPFAEATVRALSELSPISRAVVSHGDPAATRKWLRAIGATPDLGVCDDPEREQYARWGLGLTTTGHFLGGSSLGAVAALLARGIHNRAASGTRYQQAGAFAIDASGTVVWRHLPRHAGDLPHFEGALASALG